MKSDNKERAFDTGTALKLLDPKESGIPLLPLSDVEQHRSTVFWAAVFFGFFATLFGALVSLITTAYANKPVILILGLSQKWTP